MMCWEGHSTHTVFSPKFIIPVYSWEKNPTNSNWGTLYKIPDQTPQDCRGHIKVMKNKERLRNSDRPEQSKKTWWLNAMWHLGLNSGIEKELVKTELSLEFLPMLAP